MKKIIVLLILSILIFSVSACKESKTGLESGFVLRDDIVSPYQCAYKSDKTIFDMNNVTLKFYYGIHNISENMQDEPDIRIRLFFVKGVKGKVIEDYKHHDFINDPNFIFIKDKLHKYLGGRRKDF